MAEKKSENLNRKVLPVRDHSKLKFPHIDHNEIEIQGKVEEKEEPKQEEKKSTGPRGQEIINGKVLLGRGVDLSVPLPIYLPVGRKGNYEITVDKSKHTGPGAVNSLFGYNFYIKHFQK